MDIRGCKKTERFSMKHTLTILTISILFLTKVFCQEIRSNNRKVEIILWKDNALNVSDTIRSILITTNDTVINLSIDSNRFVEKIGFLKNTSHELQFVINADTLKFSFLNLKSYISLDSPVATWTIKVFTDMILAKKYYDGVAVKLGPNTKGLFSFTCDLCKEETFTFK